MLVRRVVRWVPGVLVTPALVASQSEPLVTTEHQITVAGRPLRYQATAGRLDIVDSESDEIRARMFFVAYRLAPARSPRPVMFLWNGGPGSASYLLHFESVGPKRLEGGRLVDNQETILPIVDLVFVDAVGTGFSRVSSPRYAPEFYNTLGDIAAFTEFIRSWRLLFDAAAAPVFLAGESFGSNRAAGVAEALARRRISVGGIALISGGLGLDPNLPHEVAVALRIPEWAAIALHHGKGPIDLGPDTEAAMRVARAWALDTYAPAVARAAELTEPERDAILQRLSYFTGVPTPVINRQTLVITPREYRTELLRDRGMALANFDLRRTTPIAHSPQERAAMEAYLRRDLKYRTALPYVGLGDDLATGYYATGVASPDSVPRSVNARWDYFAPGTAPEVRAAAIAEAIRVGGGPPGISLPWTQRAFERNPTLKILIATGMYDAGTCLLNEERVRRLPTPFRDAFTVRCYAGGHMMYKDTPARIAFSADLRRLVAAGTAVSANGRENR